MSQEEADYHLHFAATHANGTARTSSRHNSIVRKVVKDSVESKNAMLTALDTSLVENSQTMLDDVEHCFGEDAKNLFNIMLHKFQKEVKRATWLQQVGSRQLE